MNKIIVIALSMFLFSSQVVALGSVKEAKITHIRVDNNGRAMIYFDKRLEGSPASCTHSAYRNVLAIDASTEGGKAVLSMALAAKTSQNLVTAYGYGFCGVYGGSVAETWNHGFML